MMCLIMCLCYQVVANGNRDLLQEDKRPTTVCQAEKRLSTGGKETYYSTEGKETYYSVSGSCRPVVWTTYVCVCVCVCVYM